MFGVKKLRDEVENMAYAMSGDVCALRMRIDALTDIADKLEAKLQDRINKEFDCLRGQIVKDVMILLEQKKPSKGKRWKA